MSSGFGGPEAAAEPINNIIPNTVAQLLINAINLKMLVPNKETKNGRNIIKSTTPPFIRRSANRYFVMRAWAARYPISGPSIASLARFAPRPCASRP